MMGGMPSAGMMLYTYRTAAQESNRSTNNAAAAAAAAAAVWAVGLIQEVKRY